MGSLTHSLPTTNSHSQSFINEIREGDWEAYQLHSNQSDGKDFVSRNDSTTAYRRQCALAYLGKRAQIHGGICNKMQARVFSMHYLVELDATNKKQRFSRYPWLEKFTNLIAEIEREQGNISFSENVISLTIATK